MTALRINGYQRQLGAMNGAQSLNELARKTGGGRPSVPDSATSGVSFDSEMKKAQASTAAEAPQTGGVKFSKHALKRLHSRNVEVTPVLLEQLSAAMDKAVAKGAKETLVLGNDSAYVVAPQNRTVISAFDRNNLREGVFTSIDSAVIL